MSDPAPDVDPTPDVDPAPDEALNPAAIRLAAMNLLARREHSLDELRAKLSRRFPDGDLVEAQLQQLAAENLQSDARYAASLLRQRVSRGQGPLRIRRDMRRRGVSADLVDAAMARESVDWEALAREVSARKFGDTPAADRRERARRVRFLQYRGFASEHYQHLLRD